MIPTLLKLGPLPIHSFGLMMVLAFFAAWRILWLELVEGGARGELAERMITWAAIGGIVGARMGFLLSFPGEFLKDPLGTIFGGAGFVFLWGFVGGALAVCFLLRREGLTLLRFADMTAPSLCIGYAVGRIGCQLSGDGDYGMMSSLPWAMGYPKGVVPTPPGILVHPTPVYETFMALAIAWFLLTAAKRFPLGSGVRFGIYLILSSLARFVVEFVRIEPLWGFGLTQAQLVSILLSTAGIIMIIRYKRRGALDSGTTPGTPS